MPYRKGGFTVFELVVTIAIFSVVSVLITVLTVNINSFNTVRRSQNDAVDEVNDAESLISSWFATYCDDDHAISEVISDATDGYYIDFDDRYYLIFAEGVISVVADSVTVSEKKYDHIQGISFDYNVGLGIIKCSITTDVSGYPYDFLLYKRV